MRVSWKNTGRGVGLLLAVGLIAITGSAADADAKTPPLVATCAYAGGAQDAGTRVVLHLSAYDADGTAYYRILTAQMIEVIVKPDGSIGSERNPCKDDVVPFK